MLLFIAQLFVGLLFYYLMKARRYITKRQFVFKKWVDENLIPFIWGSCIILVVCLSLFVGGESIFSVVQFFGLNLNGIDSGGEGAGILLGGAIGEYTKSSHSNKKKDETENK